MTGSTRRIAICLAAIAVVAAGSWLVRDRWQPSPPAPAIAGETDAADRSAEPGVVGDVDARSRVAEPLPAGEQSGPVWRVRGAVLLDAEAAFVDAPRVLVHRGEARDRRLDFASVMDEVARDAPNISRLETKDSPIAAADVAPDGSFAFQVRGTRHLRLVLDHRYWSFGGVLPVHLPEEPGDVEIGPFDALLGAHVIGRLLGGEQPDDARVRLVADLDPMAVLQDPAMFMAHALRGGGAEARIGSDGWFEFRAVTPSPGVTIFLESESLPAHSERFSIAAGETREVVLRPIPTGAVEAMVLRADDRRPLTSARVSAIPLEDDAGEHTRRTMTRRARTDANGKATLATLPLGRYRIAANHGECRPETVEVVIGAGETTPIALLLDPGGTVRGVIVGATGEPIAGAGVEQMPEMEIPILGDATAIMGEDLFGRLAEHASCRSGEDGAFALGGVLLDAPVAIAVAHPDYASTIARGVRAGDADLRVVLERMGAVHGRVVDAANGAPIPTFTVRTKVAVVMFFERTSRLLDVAESTDGSFRLAGLAPGDVEVEIDAPGYAATERRAVVASGTELDLGTIDLEPAATIRGRVVSPDGEPVAGASVSRKRGGVFDNPLVAEIFGSGSVRTARDGTFEMIEVAPGGVILLASAPGFAKATSARLEIGAGTLVEDVEIELGLGGSVAGRLLLPPGRSTAGWKILATLDVQGALGTSKVAADGSFRIDGLDPGGYQIQAMDAASFERTNLEIMSATEVGGFPDIGALMRAMQDHVVSARAVVRAGETTEVELDASDFDAVGIRLVGEVRIGERLVASGIVEVETVRGDVPRVTQALVEGGRFEIHRLGPGAMRLQLRAGMTLSPVGEPLTVEIAGDRPTERISWQLPGGRIAGRVVDDESGEPIVGACVKLQNADARGGRIDFGFALTGDEGRFAFEGLAPGTYTVVADETLSAGERHSGGRLEALRLGDGDTLEDLVLRARPGAGLAIAVVDRSGSPVAHAFVLAVDADGQPVGSFPIALTDRDGRAWLSGLPSGRTRIVVRHDRFAPEFSELRELVAGAHVELRLPLEHGTAVEVEALDGDGAPLEGARFAVRWGETPWIPASMFATPVGARIDLGQLPPGRCKISVAHPRASYTVERVIPSSARARLVLTPP